MTIVVVTEKPSVARDIARVLGARKQVQGFLEGNGYVVTWALGHLVHFADPDDYGPQWSGRWSTGQLPMVPQQWKLKTARSTVKQFQVVKKLINDARTEQLICATDAGREGENIFRLIYEHARCNKPYHRLWVSSLTDEAIGEGFRRLRPGSAFDGLGQAARARAQADWLVGMNLTRAYTVHNRVLCTIGGCPLCKQGEIVETTKAYGCSRYREGCRLTIWKTVAGLKLAKQQVEQLLREGRTARIEGFTSKAGKPFAARLKLGEGFKMEFDFADGPQREAVPGSDAAPDQAGNTAVERPAPARAEARSAPASLTCPKCGQGCIIKGRRGYGCNRFREGCDFVVWKEISGKQLTEKQVHALVGKGKTRLIKGFNGRSGKKFDARLRLDEQWKVVFEFPNSKRN